MKQFDIIIAGGAMAGSTLALALKQKNSSLKIAVVESYSMQGSAHPGFDARSIALSYGTQQLLQQFELWQELSELATPIEHIHVSDKGHAGMTEISCYERDVAALGYVVELADVGRLFTDKLVQKEGISLFCPDSVEEIESEPSAQKIRLSSGEWISGKLLVAADGADSECCRLLQIEQQEYDFQQTAIIANIVVSEAHRNRAYERFTRNGPLALLPMSEGRMSLVWCQATSEVESTLSLSDEEFLSKLQAEFGWRLGSMEKVGERASYPLLLKKKSKLVHHRFAAIGNASQLLHPIAGQGFNLGIRDIASLVEEVACQADPGEYSGLSAYRNRRYQDRKNTIELTAGMVSIFSNEWLPLCAGRNLALSVMDNVPVIKEPLLKRTMGLVER